MNLKDLKLNHKQLEDIIKQLLKFEAINEENKSLVFKFIDKIIIDDNKITIYKLENIAIIKLSCYNRQYKIERQYNCKV